VLAAARRRIDAVNHRTVPLACAAADHAVGSLVVGPKAIIAITPAKPIRTVPSDYEVIAAAAGHFIRLGPAPEAIRT
jgi:hypothetical protein